MSERGFKPLSPFLILRWALRGECRFRALFEISGGYELGATLWGTEQYNKWASLKTSHCSWAPFVLSDSDFSGMFCGGGSGPAASVLWFQLWVWRRGGRQGNKSSYFLKELAYTLLLPFDINTWDKPWDTHILWVKIKQKLPFICMYLLA